jgi:hypothetical protein
MRRQTGMRIFGSLCCLRDHHYARDCCLVSATELPDACKESLEERDCTFCARFCFFRTFCLLRNSWMRLQVGVNHAANSSKLSSSSPSMSACCISLLVSASCCSGVMESTPCSFFKKLRSVHWARLATSSRDRAPLLSTSSSSNFACALHSTTST